MILSEFQKEIVDKIIKREITSVTSFIRWRYADKKINIINYLDNIIDSNNNKYKLSFLFENYDGEKISLYEGDLPEKSDIFLVDNYEEVGAFIALWIKLEKEGYIISTKSVIDKSQLLCYMKRKQLIDISSSFQFSVQQLKEAFKSFDELDKFIDKNFSNLSKEDKEKKKSELMYNIEKENERGLTYEKANDLLNKKKFVLKYKENYYHLNANEGLIKYIGSYTDKVMIPLNDLIEFKENKYQSPSDLKYQRERKERIIAQSITVFISILSIVLSIYSTFIKNKAELTSTDIIKRVYQSQDKLNKILMRYDKILSQYLKQ